MKQRLAGQRRLGSRVFIAASLCGSLLATLSFGADPIPKTAPPASSKVVEKSDSATKIQPLNKQETVLLDLEGKRLLIKSHVCLRKGTLELLCCLKQTKEHEAIVSVNTKAYVVHAGLLALGAEAGQPVQFEPEFKPASGQKIDIFMNWTDAGGKPHRVAAQEWIRYVTLRFYAEKLPKLPDDVKLTERLDEMRYDPKEGELIWYGPMDEETRKKFLAMSKDKAFQACIEKFFQRSQSRQMQAHWVFSGSSYYVDDQTKEKFYRAEDGDLICVANFGSATIDVAARSGNGAEELLFEAWTERIPEVGTSITIELVPVKDEKAEKGPEKAPVKVDDGAKTPDVIKKTGAKSTENGAKEAGAKKSAPAKKK